ncbi:hypothetical protein Adt_36943 [Abeliophyllum distichum]|uniref:PMI1/PMIR1-2 C-terminal domain-containing protein n=1 Tax=Abeliophyllum distichum TaxID=126358 RepID=A0ABD1QJ08_9LAMI
MPPEAPPLLVVASPCRRFRSICSDKNGGFLQSMSSTLFRNAKDGVILMMQMSSHVVVPAEMGSGVMEILHGLASVGIEKLSMRVNKLMPLENGKTLQQIAWGSGSGSGAGRGGGRWCFFSFF